jgi:Holliday junction DNA helicase RuvA
MIARLAGRLHRKAPESLVVDVNGVGYQVFVSLNAFAALPAEGDPVELAIHTQVRENAFELFGFLEPTEEALFAALLGVSGVGPRMALNILSGLPTRALIDALADGDVPRLVSMPGVGRKTADRLVVELRERASRMRMRPADDAARTPLVAAAEEAVSALVNLGYRQADAEKAVRWAREQGSDDLAGMIRQALRRLSS